MQRQDTSVRLRGLLAKLALETATDSTGTTGSNETIALLQSDPGPISSRRRPKDDACEMMTIH